MECLIAFFTNRNLEFSSFYIKGYGTFETTFGNLRDIGELYASYLQ